MSKIYIYYFVSSSFYFCIRNNMLKIMCTNMFAWLLKILCKIFIAFDQNKIIYDKKKIFLYIMSSVTMCFILFAIIICQLIVLVFFVY